MITASIIDYLGKYEGGVMVSIGLMLNDKYYDAIFYYTETQMIINTDDVMKKDIGDIEQHDSYYDLMESLINLVQPYEEVYKTLEEYIDNEDQQVQDIS